MFARSCGRISAWICATILYPPDADVAAAQEQITQTASRSPRCSSSSMRWRDVDVLGIEPAA